MTLGPRDNALAQVDRLGACAVRPVISAATRTEILDAYAIADTAGNLPGSTAWAPTYDVNGAVAEVWRSKAAQVAADFTFTADDATFNKGDVLAQMLAMESKYAALSVSDRATRYGGASTLNVSGTNTPLSMLDQIASQVIP